ncbi:MAG: ATPase domain-containing protein [Trichodesmium sp.]
MCSQRVSVGIDGLNEVLDGGLIAGGAYLIRGGPGTGKTTLGFHFLSTGNNLGEKTLFITLGESEKQLRKNGSSQNFNLKNINILDLSPTSEIFAESQNYDIFSPMEVEKEPLTKKIIEQLEIIEPQRVFLDSMTHFRYLINDTYQFHKQILSFLSFIKEKKATFLFTSEASIETPDDDLQFMVDGIIDLKFTKEERNITVKKFRSSDFRKGSHSMNLTDNGMKVYPIILPDNYKIEFKRESISSGIPDLDQLLQGGIERGTVSIFTGPSGVGKTSLGMQFMKEAAGRGENSVVCCFEEAEETLIQRCESINIPVKSMIDKGTLTILTIEPLLNTPEEFSNLVRKEVEENSAKIVMLDSISGYQLCFNNNNLINHLHALSRYLKNRGVASIIINEIDSITGDFKITETGISYLADNILFLRYLEIRGELKKSIGVIKKRLSDFEKTLRELEITRYGIKVGKPLTNLRGILTGTPDFINPHSDY